MTIYDLLLLNHLEYFLIIAINQMILDNIYAKKISLLKWYYSLIMTNNLQEILILIEEIVCLKCQFHRLIQQHP